MRWLQQMLERRRVLTMDRQVLGSRAHPFMMVTPAMLVPLPVLRTWSAKLHYLSTLSPCGLRLRCL